MRLLLLSTSTVYGGTYLDYCTDALAEALEGVDELVFVPFARPGGISHDDYTATARRRFSELGVAVRGAHEGEPGANVDVAQAVFVGGGNTFVLLRALYAHDLVGRLRARVEGGMPYLGSSAGINVAGRSIQTTNDMPIVYPPTFDALGLVPFNLNPHYLDPVEGSRHMGETRETRIREFHVFNPAPVLGLREGAWLRRVGATATVEGVPGGRLFRAGAEAEELGAGTDVSHLLAL